MSVHYDLEKIEANFRQALENATLPENAQRHMLVKSRAGEVELQIMLMFFRELNRGTQFSDIMRAMASITCNAIMNMALPLIERDGPEMGERIADTFLDELEFMLHNAVRGGSYRAGSATITATRGGHA